MIGGPWKAFAAYFGLLAGSIASLGGLSSILTRHAFAELSAAGVQAKPHLSRVERGLIRQARAAGHHAARHRVEVFADAEPAISAADLAKAMDAAEQVSAADVRTGLSASQSPARVAGWIRRKSEARFAQDADQSTARIIARSLRSDL